MPNVANAGGHLRLIAGLLTLIALLAISANAQYSAPRIFFSDLQSGPNSGGQDNLGAIVTIYGKGFGGSQGTSTVTVGGIAVARYFLWSDSKIAFQLGAVPSGNIVVNAGGVSSNGVPFKVRAGRIFFVSKTGSNTQNGAYATPWATIVKAKNAMAAGDITYVMDGVTQTAVNSNYAALAINSAGASGQPKAIVAYPGARVSIGSSSATTYGIGPKSIGTAYSNWVFAGLIITGASEAVEINSSTDWRLVGNDISCPNASGTGACVNVVNGSRVQLLGNTIHNTGLSTATSLANYEAVAFSNVNTIDAGWNTVANTTGCRAIAFSSSSANQFGLTVHDNFIHDARCDGISLQNVDPSQGSVQVYNNIVYRAGTGPAPAGVEASYACVNIGGSGLGTAQVLNNTFYDCGARGNADSGFLAVSTTTSAVNNIFYATSGESYLTPNTSSSWLSGSNNLFYGAGAAPAPFQQPVNANPLLVNPAGYDFHLQAGSPAIGTGINTGVAKDYDGVPRPQAGSYDIGAFEYSGTVTASGQLTQTPSTLSFGTVAVGASSTQSVTISNAGTGNITVTQMAVSGAGFSGSGLTLPLTLAPGQSSSYTVTFSPAIAGSVSGSVSLAVSSGSTTTQTSTVQLSGMGAAPAGTLTATPASLAFGSVNVGASSSQTVTITANSASVSISQANLTGAGFSVSGLTLPTTLAAGQSLSFSVKFAPAVAGSVTGNLSLISNASGSPATISLSGNGTAATSSATTSCPCSIWPVTAVPGVADQGPDSSVELGVRFKADINGYITGVRFYKSGTNTGTHVGNLWNSSGTLLASATFTNESSSGWQQVNFASPVAITAGTVYVASYHAPAGHYAQDQNYFASAGTDNAPLHALQNGGVYAYGTSSAFPSQTWNASNYWVDVVFTSTASLPTLTGVLTATPNALDFGNVTVGMSSSQTVTVTASTASVTISQANLTGAGFSVNGLTLPATIVAGQSLSFTVRFAPTAAGSVSGGLALVSNASNTPTPISLTGSGTAAPAGTLNVVPSSLSFGSITVGSSSSQTLTVTASTASVTISQANVTGAGFTVSGLTLPATLAAGQSLSFTVNFAPTAAGSVTGSLALLSNASNTPANITMAGTGVAATATAHSATLRWTASTSTNVVGYNVLRGTQSGGPYTQVNSTTVAGTSYTDSTVTAGTTYYYVVTAVDGSGNQSPNSSQVSATIPTP
jgi:hypothetical protein